MSESLTENELYVLENMLGQCFDTREKAAAEIRRLRAQLPDGMKHCTIRAKSCRLGHTWLTADNWVQHGCPTCEELKLRAELAYANAKVNRLAMALREAIAQLRWLNQRPAWATAGPFIAKLEAVLADHDASKVNL